MGMGTLCTGKKAPIYGHGDTLHWQKGPQIWAWGHFALAKRPPHMSMGTVCDWKARVTHKQARGFQDNTTSPHPRTVLPCRVTEAKCLHCVRTAWALRAHCVHIAHAEARILTQEYLSLVY